MTRIPRAVAFAEIDLSRVGPDSPLRALARTQGRVVRRRPRDDEWRSQCALFAWADSPATRAHYPELAWMFAVPNGGARSKATAGKLKASGVRRGIPDILLLAARGGHFGLCLELKLPGGKARPDQAAFLLEHAKRGYAVRMVRVTPTDISDAVRAITEYLELPPTRTAT